MRKFAIVPRGKKYWVEETDDAGACRMIVGFGTEEAALHCLHQLQAQERKDAS
jgi:hypothetical protein